MSVNGTDWACIILILNIRFSSDHIQKLANIHCCIREEVSQQVRNFKKKTFRESSGALKFFSINNVNKKAKIKKKIILAFKFEVFLKFF